MLWILCAERRILAAKEDGFIGLAGTQVSEQEAATLKQLSMALGVKMWIRQSTLLLLMGIDKPIDEVKFLCLLMFQTTVGPVFPVEEKSAL